MRKLALIMGLIVVMTAQVMTAQVMSAQAKGRESRFLSSLRQLAPEDRLVQICDYTFLRRISKEHRKKYRPDRAVAGARSESKITNHSIEAKGGAFRSRGKWYAFTYSCTATPDHMKVLSLNYTIGEEIPPEKWAAYGLWK